MVTIFFEAHATSFDNEQGLSSGWSDVRLSPKGTEQARQLGKRYFEKPIDAVFCSDLERAHQTATIAFDFHHRRLYIDWRLRECDYGDLTQHSEATVGAQKVSHISVPFPRGESYEQAMQRMRSFLADLKAHWDGKTVLIIGHRATQYGLEHWINGKTLEQCLTEPWHWQPGWQYHLK